MVLQVPVDASLKAAAALVSAVFAFVVVTGAPRRSPNLFLGGFLLLISGNQAVEAVRAVVRAAPALDGAELLAFRVATVFAALDPLFLYYFASLYPTRNALNRGWRVAAVLAPGVVLALASGALLPVEGASSPPMASWLALLGWADYTALVYGVVYVHVLRETLRSDDAGLSLLHAGLCFAAFPAWTRAIAMHLQHADLPWWAPYWLAACAVVAVALVLAHRRAYASAAPRVRVGVVRAVLAASALTLFVYGTPLLVPGSGLHWSFDPLPWVARPLSAGAASLRWLLFGLLVSLAVVRHNLLGAGPAARRRAARVLIGFVFLGTGTLTLGVAHAFFGDRPLALSLLDALVLAAAVLASQGSRVLVDRVAAKVYGVPMPGDVAATLEAYRQGAMQAAAEGRTLATDPELRRLREELGLDARAAGVVERMVAEATEGPIEAGRLVAGRYRVGRLVGRGGSGRVFLARDELLRRDVVLKEVPSDEDDAAVLHEARVTGGLSHPNIVTILDVVTRKGATVLVTEYLPGGSLAERVESAGPLPLDEGARVIDGVLCALETVHAKGIVHRDVKPSNVLLAADGTPKLADFGIARVRRGTTVGLRERDRVRGTPEAMAPEQRRGEVTTPATDLYAVGLLMQRCLAEPLPPTVRDVHARALVADPEGRWPSAGAMRAALREALAAHVTPGT